MDAAGKQNGQPLVVRKNNYHKVNASQKCRQHKPLQGCHSYCICANKQKDKNKMLISKRQEHKGQLLSANTETK